jgi:hypothetical protein
VQRLLLLGLVVALASSGAVLSARDARSATVVLPPAAEASFPFFCSWGYDWEERCSWDVWSHRLSIGGDRDKVWRAGLRFSLGTVPPGSAIVRARVFLHYDRVCVGLDGGSLPCDGRRWDLEVVPILGSWFDEREPYLGFPVAWATIPAGEPAHWLVVDVTDLVAEWVDEALENDGLLVKLADAQEDFLGSGPKPPGRRFPTPSLRPRLEIDYLPPG